MKSFKIAAAFVVLAAFVACSGCSGQKPIDIEFGGFVTQGENPVGGATLTFVPADGKGETFTATTSPGGSFAPTPANAKKVRSTTYKVGVVADGLDEKFADPETSGVTLDVKKSDEAFQIRLPE